MAKRYVALATVAMFATGYASTALAGQTGPSSQDLVPLGQQQFFNDPPMSHLNALEFARTPGDTTYYGGVDGGGYLANEVKGSGGGGTAIWTFESGTTEGWTSIDQTDLPIYVRRVTSADFATSPADGTITAGGSTASLWFGAFQLESEVGCWPGGMGYSNGYGLRAGKTLPYGGGNVALSFDYYVDSETQFDFTYVYVIQSGVTSDPLNTSLNPNPDTGLGYSGGGFESTAIGSPTAPESESITIDASNFPFGAGTPYELQFNFDSDPLFSDGLDSFSAGYYDSEFGPFGVDNILVDGGNEGDFEGGTDGWDFKRDTPIGKLIQVRDLAELDAIADPCDCPLSQGDNQYVLIAANVGVAGQFPHPKKQHEELLSNPADVSGNPNNTIGMLWSAWADNPFDAGVGYRRGIHYYPWTCPETSVVSWTIEIAGPGGYTFTDPASCGRFIQDFSTFYPAGSDSVRLAIDFLGDCDDFGVDECIGPDQTNQTPYLDDIQIWTVGSALAPSLALDQTYGDRFPIANSIVPSSPVNVGGWYDNNRADSDQTNANMGDSAVVLAGTQAGTRVFLNFRVYPGPATDTGDEFFGRYGGGFIADGVAPDPFAVARMDSAETDSGVQAGLYATYLHEAEGGVEGSPTYKLIPDGVLTPGTTVEYFFTGDFGVGQPQDVNPDTTGGFFLEWEALPGYFQTDGAGTILGPCVLYVDAFNNGAQVPIEEFGLAPYLGNPVDNFGLAHQGWDRYDYIGGANNTPAPLARESSGDNGMTKYQSLFYETMLYNTGSNAAEGLRDGDADLIINWLTTDDLGRTGVTKGLWLSGNGMANILSKTGRADANFLLEGFAEASITCDTYRDPGCGGGANGDSTYCVRLDPVTGADFGTPVPYSAASRNGCPNLNAYNVIDAIETGNGNLEYNDQDDGGDVTRFASVSSDNLTAGNPYGVVLDAFSLHYMRRVDAAYSGGTRESCETLSDGMGGFTEDSTAITTRVEDVLGWFGITPGANLCDWVPLVVSAPGGPSTSLIPQTVLHQNAPNPFNPRTTVRYDLAEEAQVTLQIFDVTGKLVRTLVNEVQAPEAYSIVWDGSTDSGSAVSSGVYWARMSTSTGFKSATKMVVLK